MRMILPPLKERRAIDRLLSAFFNEYKASDFKKAISGAVPVLPSEEAENRMV